VPFCAHRCGYCNFTVTAGRPDLIPRFLDVLEMEIGGLSEPHPITTLFVGGGTPTRMNPQELARLFRFMDRWLPVDAGGEVTIEANPADVDSTMASCLADCGVTRVSLGAQSFAERKLRALDRDHSRREVDEAVFQVKTRGLTLSLDLIFGAPGETLEEWQSDLETALLQAPDHVSVYGLTYEKGTRFWSARRSGRIAPVDEELERDLFALAIDGLTAAGFEHYEVSNFAGPAHRCRHNETYWAAEPYLAFGPGASRYVNGRRETNHRSTSTWLKRVSAGQSPVAESEQLGPEDRAREALVLGLRRMRGVDRAAFLAQTGFDLFQLAGGPLRRFLAEGWLVQSGPALRLTRAGLFISDSLWPYILRV
jgi:oxygen-independent coproporphyrinogen-3 oxidase